MKKILAILMILIITTLSGCVNSFQYKSEIGNYYAIKNETYEGSLVLADDIRINPNIELKENNEIFISKGAAYSYAAYGTYDVENDNIVFEIIDGSITLNRVEDKLHIISATGYFTDLIGLEFILHTDSE